MEKYILHEGLATLKRRHFRLAGSIFYLISSIANESRCNGVVRFAVSLKTSYQPGIIEAKCFRRQLRTTLTKVLLELVFYKCSNNVE